jgi:hypothetical protein
VGGWAWRGEVWRVRYKRPVSGVGRVIVYSWTVPILFQCM